MKLNASVILLLQITYVSCKATLSWRTHASWLYTYTQAYTTDFGRSITIIRLCSGQNRKPMYVCADVRSQLMSCGQVTTAVVYI